MQILEDPVDVRLALIYLRVLHGWNQTELAERAGINKSLVSLYELEKQVPSAKTFSRLLSAFQVSISTFETVISFVRIVRQLVGGSEEVATEFITTTARLMAMSTRISLSHDLASLLTRGPEMLPEELCSEPEQLGEWFLGANPEMQKTMATDLREYHTWEFCEWLFQEMGRTLEADPAEAARLAELAVDVAVRVPEGRKPRRRLQGYAWAHLSRARRATGDLPGAEEAITRARELWEACGPDDPDVGLADRFMGLVAG